MTAVAPGVPAAAFRWDGARILVLVVLCTAQLIESIDVTVVNVALPAIGAGLDLDDTDLQWVVSAYVVLFGGCLLLGGRCADLLGMRRVFMTGIALFTLASLACGLTDSGTALVVSRAVQGLAAAFIAPAALGMLSSVFPDGPARARAMGIWGAVTGVSASLGVVAGGLLTTGPGWRWIFFVNLPIGLGLLLAAARWLPPGRGTRTLRDLDVRGAALVTASMLLLVFGASQSGGRGSGSAVWVTALVLGAVALAVFVRHEIRLGDRALIPVGLLRTGSVAAANLLAVLVGSGMLGMFFLLSLYQQEVLHLSALRTGLNYLPLTALLMVCAFAAPVLVQRIGLRAVLVIGCALASAGVVLMSMADPTSGVFVAVIGPSMIAAPGLALTFIPLTMAAVAGLEPAQAGVAAGLANATRTVGGALGLAGVSAVVASQAGAGADAAIGRGFLVCAAFLGVGALVAAGVFSRE